MSENIQKQQSGIKDLIAKGREQGYLTYAEVNDHLPED
ncbi:MAG: RNA polymerase sigma factor region1.1 domain-containing protein, partial [Porticoccaceae bacterium]